MDVYSVSMEIQAMAIAGVAAMLTVIKSALTAALHFQLTCYLLSSLLSHVLPLLTYAALISCCEFFI